jgi:DtxR family Mn-dependent transcriptional regulator
VSGQRLSELAPNKPAEILRVLAQGDGQLRYLAALGLVPGAAVRLEARAPFDGPLQLVVGGTAQFLDFQLAQQIVVAHQKD